MFPPRFIVQVYALQGGCKFLQTTHSSRQPYHKICSEFNVINLHKDFELILTLISITLLQKESFICDTGWDDLNMCITSSLASLKEVDMGRFSRWTPLHQGYVVNWHSISVSTLPADLPHHTQRTSNCDKLTTCRIQLLTQNDEHPSRHLQYVPPTWTSSMLSHRGTYSRGATL